MTSLCLPVLIGRVIGVREVRVGNDKVSISRLLVRVISGLQLNISPDSAIENGYVSETTVTRRLTAQYQVCKKIYLRCGNVFLEEKTKERFKKKCKSAIIFSNK